MHRSFASEAQERAFHQAAKALLRVQVEQEIHEHNAITCHLACPGAQDACRDHVTFQQHHRIDAWEKVESRSRTAPTALTWP